MLGTIVLFSISGSFADAVTDYTLVKVSDDRSTVTISEVSQRSLDALMQLRNENFLSQCNKIIIDQDHFKYKMNENEEQRLYIRIACAIKSTCIPQITEYSNLCKTVKKEAESHGDMSPIFSDRMPQAAAPLVETMNAVALDTRFAFLGELVDQFVNNAGGIVLYDEGTEQLRPGTLYLKNRKVVEFRGLE